MNEILNDLNQLNEEIAEAKTEVAVLKSKKDDAMKQLRTEFGVKTLTEAKQLLAKKKEEKDKLEETIKNNYEKLKENYQW
jgi:adenylyl- and sulfurtransferase ThiI